MIVDHPTDDNTCQMSATDDSVLLIALLLITMGAGSNDDCSPRRMSDRQDEGLSPWKRRRRYSWLSPSKEKQTELLLSLLFFLLLLSVRVSSQKIDSRLLTSLLTETVKKSKGQSRNY